MISKLESNASGMPVWISRDILNNYLRGANGNKKQISDAVKTFQNLTHYSLQKGIYGTNLANRIIEEILKNKKTLE
ncbi:MAG: hypothetical protein KKF67_02760 [Nanoarchaeota archaeon]|nr:hypothetical protein [Nanoarchaeota archaeon]